MIHGAQCRQGLLAFWMHLTQRRVLGASSLLQKASGVKVIHFWASTQL